MPLLFCCLAVRLMAQDASLLPGLYHELASSRNDTARADVLARMCFNLIHSDPDSALLVGEQALRLARRIGNQRALGDAHNDLGWLAAQQGLFVRADSLLNIALGIFEKIEKPQYTSVVLSNLGWLAEKKGDSVGSVQRFQQALTLSEQARDTATGSILLYSLGIAYRKIKDYPQAVEHLERSRSYERKLGRLAKEANCVVGLANVYRETGDTATAEREFRKAAAMYARVNDHNGAGIVEENLGDLLLDKDPAAALLHFIAAKAHYDTLRSTVDKAYVLLRIGTALMRTDRTEAAGAALKEGLSLAADTGDPNLVMEYELCLAELCKVQGDSEGTFAHFTRYVALKDSLQGQDTQHELARLRTEFETERKEKDNVILRAANSEKEERIRRGRFQLVASIALGMLVLAAALLLLRNYLLKRKHTFALELLNHQLASNNAEITEINGLLEMKLLRSQMNPHFIYNCISSAARMTQSGHQAEALRYLQGFARLLRMVLDHSVNDTVGIEEERDFLEQYLGLEAVRLDGLRYDIQVDGDLVDDDVRIPSLLVQPFVENAIWHGLAHTTGERVLNIHFSGNERGLTCTITDSGIGRGRAAEVEHADRTHRSLGMQLTSERLRLLARRLSESGSITMEDLVHTDGRARGTRVVLQLATGDEDVAKV